ncbi:hypothetical protein ABPG75_007211 [Micractinium tetrahymenae]
MAAPPPPRPTLWRSCLPCRLNNESSVGNDLMGYAFATAIFPLYLGLRVWWRDGLPGVALSQAPVVLGFLALMCLIRLQREVYVRHREPLMLAACIPLFASITSLHAQLSGHPTAARHGGSPWRLLLLLLLPHASLWVLLAALVGRLLVRWNYICLSVLAWNTLRSTGGICDALLQLPGVEQSLAQLHFILQLAHSPTVFLPAGAAHLPPSGQCRSIMAWLTLSVGVLAPLAMLAPQERRARRRAKAVVE